TIDKIRLKEFLGTVDDNIVEKVDSVLKISLALN
ncbi:MAG: PemK family transcriptional regulator, partial [Peptostreptococcaceae bacterium]|nr:PemK family transcriptional regulator [Peptostreptococcaceae bacterium]